MFQYPMHCLSILKVLVEIKRLFKFSFLVPLGIPYIRDRINENMHVFCPVRAMLLS
jgi:hypothetical protein